MKKTFPLAVILDADPSIKGFADTTGLTGKATLIRRKVLKNFVTEIENFNDLKNEKIKELGTDDGSGKYSIRPNTQAYTNMMIFVNELVSTEVEVEVPEEEFRINVEELRVATSCSLTDTDIDKLIYLGILFEEGFKEKEKKVKEVKKEEPIAVDKKEETVTVSKSEDTGVIAVEAVSDAPAAV